MKKFFIEQLHNNLGYAQQFLENKTLYSHQSKFQKIDVFHNNFFGNILALDGAIQLTCKDEFFYHEMMVHVPLFSLNNPKKVLIIGGGDGGILREVLKHKSVELAVMVEIDGDVINISKEYFPNVSDGAFANPRANVIVGDGIDYVKKSTEKFDAILVDSTDPDGASEVLFTEEFYKNCKNILLTDGIIVTQSGVPFFQPTEVKNMFLRLKSVWNYASFYNVAVPTYVGGFMNLGIASNSNTTTNLITISERFNRAGIKTRYYNAEIHLAALALPQYIKELVID